MFRKSWLQVLALGISLATAALAGTIGKVVAIGGHASDIALDEARGVLYVANFTANRIEVMQLGTNTIRTSINVASQPSSVALSPDGKYLVISHFGNVAASAGAPTNGLTVIDLVGGGRQFYSFGYPPLGVAFGIDNKALISTTQDWELFDPTTGTLQVIDTITGVTAKTLPVPANNGPNKVVQSSLAVSGDGLTIWGMSDQILYYYDVNTHHITGTFYYSTPAMTPRVISTNRDGGYASIGWMVLDRSFNQVAAFWNPSGDTGYGATVVDPSRNLIYAQIPAVDPSTTPTTTTTTTTTPTVTTTPAAQPPVLQVVDADNLTLRERYKLPENLTGRGLLTSDNNTMYVVSDSGVIVIPVGALNTVKRVKANATDLVFRGSGCDKQMVSQDVLISDPGGNNVDFTLTSSNPGVTFSPASGVTPRTVRVTVDATAFQNAKGTSVVTATLSSKDGANYPAAVRVLINLHDPDQRGATVNIPGTLVDLLADPTRERLFILRGDTQQVLVYDSNNYNQIASLRTGTTPVSMAITFDRKYLLVANSNSQFVSVFDMETLQPSTPIKLDVGPKGEWRGARSIASAGGAILALVHTGGTAVLQKLDMLNRRGFEYDNLGIYENKLPLNTVLVATPNGSSIMAASDDGSTMLYDANAGTFVISRKDFTKLSGAYAASSYGQFMVGDTILNSSLVPVAKLDTAASGSTSGFAFVDDLSLRTLNSKDSDPGSIQRLDLTAASQKNTRLIEAPLAPLSKGTQFDQPFTRTLAITPSRTALVNLSVSGITVLPWTYDTPIVPPSINRVVNAADGSQAVAPGSLVSIYGSSLSPVNLASTTLPLPTALGDSCLTVNGISVPVLFVSPTQINAQLPYEADGKVTLILRTPGGISDNYNMTVTAGAPGIFSGSVGDQITVPTIVRATNNQLLNASNPIHWGETMVIYLTGLGKTTPAVAAGQPAPSNPLATVLTPVKVDIGGFALNVIYAGLTPDQVGLYQINATVPRNVPTGLSIPLTIKQGTNSTTVAIRVVE